MAFDGITVANLRYEIETNLIDGRISKIAQPEADELLLTVKSKSGQYRLSLCANAGLPYVYLTPDNKQNPAAAPGFCMLLRKHIGGGRIVSVEQPGLERILIFTVEHLDEMGDVRHKKLIIELMGKHSNIIFCDENDTIIDSIKHIPASVSSLREVLPGRPYFIPNTRDKKDPLTISREDFLSLLQQAALPCGKVLASSLTGISQVAAEEICYRASLDSAAIAQSLRLPEQEHLYGTFERMMEDIRQNRFVPNILFRQELPEEYASFALTHLGESHSSSGELTYEEKDYESISEVLRIFYASRSAVGRIRQKSVDLRKIVQTALERNVKKYDLQAKQLKDTQKREKYRLYGELLHAYGYGVEAGAKEYIALNYYDDNKEITIPLDPDLSPLDNAKRYYEKYNKQKRTYEALTALLQETEGEIQHLRSIATSLDIAKEESDLTEIKEELEQFGYIKKHRQEKRGPGYKGQKKEKRIASKPFHYLSSDGFHMYVGKNNFQNEEVTFRIADGGDWWFHAKGVPGSHVIVKTEGKELPDRTFEEAGALAAYYSSARDAEKVEIDYVKRKEVKKAPGGKPGFVIYHTNYSLISSPNIQNLTEILPKKG
jgi:predicted ribosome quality control (RQC) complex YloA/Tae2 family protein